MTETDATTIRLTKKDRQHIAAIIRSGAANSASSAIRIALYEAADKRKLPA